MGISPPTTAPPKTETGFFYPTGKPGPYRYAGWLAAGCDQYICGYYHLGVDMEANAGADVYAIADGEIVYVSVSGWGDGNYGLLVRHTLHTGEGFLALYGHVMPLLDSLKFAASGPVSPSVRVTGGQAFAAVGPYGSTPHLHFGIRPGTLIPSSPWGRMPLERWPATNGFVDPMTWITTKTWLIARLGSPAELRVYDSQGRVTGVLDGEVKVEIPNSSYHESTVMIASPSDSYRYEVAGTSEGSYGLAVTHVGDVTSRFALTSVPMSAGAVHEYAIDWDTLRKGGKGVTMMIDSDGDGVFEQVTNLDVAAKTILGGPRWIWGVLAAVAAIAAVLAFGRRTTRRRTLDV